MQMLASILLAALALAANGHLARAVRPANIEDYLPPSVDHVLMSNIFYSGQVREALIKLEVAQDASSDAIVAKFESAAQEEQTRTHKNIYRRISHFADEDSECDSQLLFDARVMYAHRNTPGLEQFQEFMRVVGTKKLAQCARIMQIKFQLSPKGVFESSFDEFYEAALGLDFSSGNAEAIRRLNSFHIGTDVFDMHAASEVIDEYNSRRDKNWDELAVATKHFIDYYCSEDDELADVLMAINLAMAYESYDLEHERLRKLNEYNRICRDFAANLPLIRDHFETLQNSGVPS